jgi:hypothetical protein
MKYIAFFLLSLSFIFSSIMEIDSTSIRNSTKSFQWSVIPIVSQGQAYNQKYLKSFLFACAQSYSLNQMSYHDQFNDIYNVKMRNKFGWWFLGFYVSSMIDSYIDSELSTFPLRKK